MSKVVRSSKYRHVFGQQAKKEECYANLKVTKSAWDSNYIAANTKYFGVIWDAGGGGSFAVINHGTQGKSSTVPLFAGHKSAVLDIAFHPFNESLVSSVSEDCNIMIWGIPDGGLHETITEPLQTLSGHKRKVGTCQFNPVANNVLATSSGDFTVKTWDVESGNQLTSLDGAHTDIILSVEWSANGSQLLTTSKDKKARVFDPRSNSVVAEVLCHQGVKNTRGIYVNNNNFLTVGFTKTSEREMKIFDPRNIAEPLTSNVVDTASGLLMPFFDPDNNILYMAGKGDGNIRYYEMVDEAPYFHFLSEYKSATPQRGICFIPKRAVNVSECEIARALKVTTNAVEPISFRVPRKSDIFQDDIFPDTYAGEPALDSASWASGSNAEPKLTSLAPGFVVKKVQQEFKPVVQAQAGPKTEKELREEYEKLKTRVAYLESEIVKKDAKIKELENK